MAIMLRPERTPNHQHYEVPVMPSPEQLNKILAFNKKMLHGIRGLLEQAIIEDQLLLKEYKRPNTPETSNYDDYSYGALFIFRHIKTNEMLLTVGWWFPQFSSLQRNIDEFHEDLNSYFPLSFKSEDELETWLKYLFEEFEVHWQEILNVGEVEIEYNFKKEFWDYNQEKPLVELA